MKNASGRLEDSKELKRKGEFYREGIKPTQDVVTTFINDKGIEYSLYHPDFFEPLTLEDGNYELILWRTGLKEKGNTDTALIQAIEQQVKARVLKNETAKDWLTEDNLFFNHEYPTDQMLKPSELKRLGLKSNEPIGAYINNERASTLYSVKQAIPLTVEEATPGEKRYWLEGLEQGLVTELNEEERQALIQKIRLSLEHPVKKERITSESKEKKTKSTTSKKPSQKKATKKGEPMKRGRVKNDKQPSAKMSLVERNDNLGSCLTIDVATLKQKISSDPTQFLFFNVVGTGIFSQDEVVQLSLVDAQGNVVYNQYFLPTATHLQSHPLLKKSSPRLTFASAWATLLPFIQSKTLLIHNPDYDLSLLAQTCKTYKLSIPTPTFVNLKPLIKEQSGYSSLEAGTHQLSWSVNKSEIIQNSLLSCFVSFSFLLSTTTTTWLAQKEKAHEIFERYCELRQKKGNNQVREEGWRWLRQNLGLSNQTQSFDLFGTNQCQFVIDRLQSYLS